MRTVAWPLRRVQEHPVHGLQTGHSPLTVPAAKKGLVLTKCSIPLLCSCDSLTSFRLFLPLKVSHFLMDCWCQVWCVCLLCVVCFRFCVTPNIHKQATQNMRYGQHLDSGLTLFGKLYPLSLCLLLTASDLLAQFLLFNSLQLQLISLAWKMMVRCNRVLVKTTVYHQHKIFFQGPQ